MPISKDLIFYGVLFIIVIVGLVFINRKSLLNKREKKTVAPDPEMGMEDIEALNQVIFLLHDMAKSYENYDRTQVKEFVEKIVVSKSWESRLESIPSKPLKDSENATE